MEQTVWKNYLTDADVTQHHRDIFEWCMVDVFSDNEILLGYAGPEIRENMRERFERTFTDDQQTDWRKI